MTQLASTTVTLRQVTAHIYVVSENTEGFETFFRGEAGKVIVTQERA